MNTELVINKLQEIFTPVAQKIGEGADFAWKVAVKQQIAEGIGNLIIAFLGLILGYAVYKIIRIAIKKCDGDSYSDWGLVGVFTGLFGGTTTLLMVVVGIYQGILHLISPEFYALQFFIGLVK